MKFITYSLLIILSLLPVCSFAQGCSDAGFCTASDMKGYHSNLNSISISSAISRGENGTNILTPQIELKKSIGKKGFIEGRLPINIASGDMGSYTSIGDLMLTYTMPLIKKLSINGTIGTKVSLGDATATNNGQPLPMPYQSNLGTTDVILGLSAKWKKYISAAVGYQQPIVQYNNNQYELSTATNKTYFESPNLERSGDVLIRLQGHYDKKKLGFSGGPLLIYHLTNDKITYTNGTKISVIGSQGLTINITGNIYYKIKNWKIDLSMGAPVMVRFVRPDGLTKSFTVIPRLTYNFKS